MDEWKASAHAGFFRTGDLVNYDPAAVGLSLSGGGYRATLFHAGAIMRLNELGVLPRIDRVSSVSGGSIAAGILAMNWSNLSFDANGVATNLEEHFLAPVLAATSRTLDIRVSIGGFLPFVSAGNRLATLYDKFIFDGMKLRDLSSRPKFIFNAANLQTGGLFRFTKHYLADWRALMAEDHQIRLAEAVAASSAFPPVLSPLRLDLSNENVVVPEGARFNEPELLREPILVDGGVYDNLGLEPVWKRCGVLIASYAGLNSAAEPSNFTLDHMVPVVFAFLASSIDWRERILINLFQHELEDGLPERVGTYWTAGTKLEDFPTHDGWKPSEADMERAAETPTRLEALNEEEQRTVIEAGYALADAGVRSHLLPEAQPPEHAPALPGV